MHREPADDGTGPAPGPGPDLAPWPGCAVVVLAGGASRRMGGQDKLAADLGGRAVLARVLDAVPPVPLAVVGPVPRLRQVLAGPPGVLAGALAGVLLVQEHPAGSGPAAALATGLLALRRSGALPDAPGDGPQDGWTGGCGLVVVLAGDAPCAPAAVPALLRALASAPEAPAAMAVDAAGRRQVLLAVHRVPALLARVEAAGGPAGLVGAPAGRLVASGAVEVAVPEPLLADVDTPGDLLAQRAHWSDRASQASQAPRPLRSAGVLDDPGGSTAVT